MRFGAACLLLSKVDQGGDAGLTVICVQEFRAASGSVGAGAQEDDILAVIRISLDVGVPLLSAAVPACLPSRIHASAGFASSPCNTQHPDVVEC